MIYLYLKSIHIIFVVTWFAGLFYMVRLFIYSTEAQEKNEPDKSILSQQLLIMQKRLWYIISWPSAIITLIVGTWLAVETHYWTHPWFHLKLLFVAGLFLYHLISQKLHTQMNNGIYKYSTTKLRLWNEIATLFLFAIVFIVVLKNTMSWIWGITGLILIGILLMLGIKIYKKFRND